MQTTLWLFLLTPMASFAQVITPAQQKALNNYIAYANHSASEVSTVAVSLAEYYPSLESSGKKYSGLNTRYTCPVQLDDFYLNKAITESKSLSSGHALSANAKLKSLRLSAEKIDAHCKALDTYYKLEDYKQDNYVKAGVLVDELNKEMINYKHQQTALIEYVEATYHALNKYIPTNAYHQYDFIMRQHVERERSFINSWTFNLNEKIHTGWPTDKLEVNILEADKQLKLLDNFKPTLKYPTASACNSFKESLGSILETKRKGLDEYNYEAQKSDRHSNGVYMNLINYFNGALVSDYNRFIEFSEVDNYYGLKAFTYFPMLEIRIKEKSVVVEIKPFQDVPRLPLQVTTQKNVLSKNVFNSLGNYIDFINESLRHVGYLQLTVGNLNSSASYYKDLASYKGKGGLQYDFKNYVLPLSLHQRTIEESKALVPEYAKPLNDQVEALLHILKELDQLSALLEAETKGKTYEKDNLKRLYETINRSKILFEMFDEKKELLYNDVRAIYNSYPAANSTSSWYVAGKALQKLVDFDREGLFKAKAYYKGQGGVSILTDSIDYTLRKVIANEYTNLKGIEKIGRNNGLCPYTPYEDLPMTSKTLSEKLNALKPATQSGYNHPYHGMVYLYNDIVDNLNKFSELSKSVLLLKTVKQPELFFEDIQAKRQKDNQHLETVNQVLPGETRMPAKEGVDKPVIDLPPNDKSKLLHDTVYIEKRDTVYMMEPGGNLHSMDGYATNNLVLLLDVSGSMNTPEKLPVLKKSVLDVLGMMRVEDKVSIVVYSGKAKVLLAPTSFKEGEKIRNVIETLTSAGKTDGNAGIKLAYKVANENYIRGGNNRIILATDGEFPISAETFQLVTDFSKQDIFISVFNFGKHNTIAKNLEKLATSGKGNFEYITKENAEFKLIKEAKSKRSK